jgi:phosphopentomutase
VLTADHGRDPAAPHTDHTRESVPGRAFLRHGCRLLRGAAGRPGRSFLRDICRLFLRAAAGRPGRSFLRDA